MRLILFLLRASWHIVLLAGVVGAASGAASVALVAMILHTLRDPQRRLVGRACGSVRGPVRRRPADADRFPDALCR